MLGKMLFVIVIIRSGYFVYIDKNDRIVNIVKKIWIEIVIRFCGWRFFDLCSIFFDGFFVIMESDDYM